MPSLSLVIVTWNSAAELPALLQSVRRHLPAAEIVVVDNASTDGTRDAAAATDSVTLITLETNVGFGAGSNVGVRAASAPAVVLLNPDTLLVDGSLEALAAYAVRQHVLAGPELVDGARARQPSASPPPAGWAAAVTAVVPARVLPETIATWCEPWRAKSTVEVGWLTGACIAASRDVLISLGPFDEHIVLYGEDMDLGLRARAAGIRSLYAPDIARVVHYGGRSAVQRFGDRGTATKLAARRGVVRRHYGRPRELYDFGSQIVFHASRWAAKRALRRDASAESAWLRATWLSA